VTMLSIGSSEVSLSSVTSVTRNSSS